MTKTEITGSIKGGVIQLNNFTRKRLQDDLRQFADCDIVLTIKKKGKRSNPQNSFYWGVCIPEIRRRLKELGNDFDAETVHEYLKGRFNCEKVEIEATGELLEIGQTTTKLTKGEFAEYLDKIIRFASESLGITIPDPGTQTEIPYMIASYDEEARATIIKKAS
jgi:hypothetical protein